MATTREPPLSVSMPLSRRSALVPISWLVTTSDRGSPTHTRHRYPDQLRRVVLLDANISGVTPPNAIQLGFESNWRSWRFLFNTVPDLPEALLQGRERILIQWSFNAKLQTLRVPLVRLTSTNMSECTASSAILEECSGTIEHYSTTWMKMPA